MRIEDRLFDRGWVRFAMATRKCGNVYFRKYFMVVRKFTNIFVLLLILMVGSRNIHYSSFASHKKSYGPTDSGCSQMSTEKMSPPIIKKPVKKRFFINGIRGDLFGYQRAT